MQSNYNEQENARIGQKYALSRAENVLSYAAEGRIPFGRFLTLGTDKESQVELPDSAAKITNKKLARGVALHTHAIENKQDGLAPGYEDTRTVSAMTRGMVVVEVEEAVTPESAVFVRFADGSGGNVSKGNFRTDDDEVSTEATAAELPDARFLTSSFEVEGKLAAVLELL